MIFRIGFVAALNSGFNSHSFFVDSHGYEPKSPSLTAECVRNGDFYSVNALFEIEFHWLTNPI